MVTPGFIYNPPLFNIAWHSPFSSAVGEKEKTRALDHVPTARFLRRDVTGTILHPAE